MGSSPAVGEGGVYVGSSDGHVYAFDADTGELRWRFLTDSRVFGSAVVGDGAIFASSEKGFVYALTPEDGTLLWQYQFDGAALSAEAVSEGVVYVTCRGWAHPRSRRGYG